MRNYPKITITEKAERSLRGGHPWVYGEEILSKNISEEDMVSEIVKMAIQKGTDDNCTAVIVVFKE